MPIQEPKYRHEYKYVISTAQLQLLKSRISGIMRPDPHVGETGVYNIRSLYFDDYHNRCFYENENGTDPREKFRIRIYNHSDQHISLECKRKDHGKTHKTSAPLSIEQTNQLMRNLPLTDMTNLVPLQRKLNLEMQTRLLHPVVIVEYDRMPYVYDAGNVRVTFDFNISSSSSLSDFLNDDIPKRPIMPAGQCLMEVKFDEFLPDFIYRNLNLENLPLSTFSKYYLARKYALHR